MDQLRKTIKDLTALNGINLEPTIDADIRGIIEENDAAVNQAYSKESFECLLQVWMLAYVLIFQTTQWLEGDFLSYLNKIINGRRVLATVMVMMIKKKRK